jgi:hypothetical protein
VLLTGQWRAGAFGEDWAGWDGKHGLGASRWEMMEINGVEGVGFWEMEAVLVEEEGGVGDGVVDDDDDTCTRCKSNMLPHSITHSRFSTPLSRLHGASSQIEPQ